jgi:peptidylprolyl isomerase
MNVGACRVRSPLHMGSLTREFGMRIRSLGLVAFAVMAIVGCNENASSTSTSSAEGTSGTTSTPAVSSTPAESGTGAGIGTGEIVTRSGLRYRDDVVGQGAEATDGRQVSVLYVGTLVNGTQFDANQDRTRPLQFTLGRGEVVRGWEEGIKGMKVGGKRHLVIPSELAYGSAGNGPVPANATLVFDVELLDVR